MKSELIFLEMARKDIVAAKCLFEKRLYPQAIFHLQQSIEKAVKSLGIHDRIITEREAKRFRHSSIKVYIKMIQHWEQMAIVYGKLREIMPEIREFDVAGELPDHIDELEKALTILKKVSENHNLILISEKGLEKFLSEIEVAREKINIEKKNVDIEREWADRTEKLYKAFEFADRIYPGSYKILKEITEKELEKNTQDRKTRVKSDIYLKLDLRFCDVSLRYLSLIFLNLAICSRYKEHGINPLEEFTEKNPLVKKFDQIVKITGDVLDILTNYFNSSRSGDA